MAILFFDTETTGMWQFKNRTLNPKQPNLVQLGALLTDDDGKEIAAFSALVFPESTWTMDPGAQAVHGISMNDMEQYGICLPNVINVFEDMYTAAEKVVAHNIKFDTRVMRKAYHEMDIPEEDHPFQEDDPREQICTMLTATPVCGIQKARGGQKWPKLEEAMQFFFNEDMNGTAHNAMADTRACARVYFKLKELGHL